ncbi:type I polyketide synthase [Nannocystis punicea]|uniref:SDR family NAD(P)-dependent oxidoreductase n=1 Tax=Nannocystis punicea TaxID=2995304 RepID=A0ABY7HC61_9BACT|nr:type I polyketide synthase [Nannocystis poenicansa]WAS96619.1 SDR family NAD(P)-dependent oxidoreductase [Nannocystis poenicansa]
MSEDQLRQYRARLKEATAVIERLRGKLTAEQARNEAREEPLAIVGAACRFPGGGDGLDAFWERLADGVDAVREIPAERWPQDTIPGGRPEVRWAALLDAVDRFDAEFFGVSPREAERLDPQQRLLLEVAWEALEDAGARVDALAGAQVGVFAGLNSLDYQHHLMRRGLADVDAYSATGTLLSTASGRISYSFGFQGPCVSLDTACSSSLVAVALACQSLRAGECEVALAGGVTLLLSPFMMALAAGTQALSPDGRCKVLDARANGFVRGEGCGMVVLKRLSDARRDGDLVRAVIRGWAINQDGRSTGLTAPNVRSQEELLRAALTRAGVGPHEVGYVEMHGTGTPLGDPIETDALKAVLGAPRADGPSCVLGAVKSNLGHLEAAAGVAGLIKATLALEREVVPKNLHFRRLNPRISLAGTPFVVPREPVPWPRGERRRIAGVSSFGISGTNVHVVLEEAPAVAGGLVSGTGSARADAGGELASGTGSARAGGMSAGTGFVRAVDMSSGTGPTQADWMSSGAASARADGAGEMASGTGSARTGGMSAGTGSARGDESASERVMRPELVVLSARSAAALDAQAERLAAHLVAEPSVGVGDVAFSLATTRTAMEHRLTLVAGSRAGLVEALAAAGRGETPAGATRGVAGRSKLALLFTGQGAQILGMGRALHAAWPAFRERFDACVALLDRELPRPLTAVMWAEPGSAAAAQLDETLFTQPALFAFEVALAALWQSWGVVPDLVAGHSIGEIAAACVVGVLSLADAARLVGARARLMQALPAGGAMTSIEADEDEVAAAVAPHAASVSIAALNGPRQVIVAGAEAAVRTICAGFAARGARTRPLRVSHAFHSPLMEPMLAAFRQATATLEFHPPKRPLVSCATGALAGPELGTPEYWVRHVREPVRFAAGVRALHAAGARSFVEVGPKPTLLGLVPGCLPADAAVTLIPSVRGADEEAAGVLAALGSVWAGGGAVRWSEVFFPGARRVRLPTYAWQRTRHWLDAPDATGRAAGEPTGHPLLGVRVAAAGVLALFETVLGLPTHPWLGDHRVVGRAVVPAAAVAELVRAALVRAASGMSRVTGLVLTTPLVLPESGALRVQVVVSSEAEVAVYSQPLAGPASAGWTRHASATGTAGSEPAEHDLGQLRARCPEAVDAAALHDRFAALGIHYGPAFRGLRSLWRGAGEALAELAGDELRMAEGLSPALLDAALQAVLATLPEAPGEALRMPLALGGFAVHGPGAAWAHVRLREEAGEVADVTLLDATGTVVAEVEELRLQVVDRAAVGRGRSSAGAMWRLAWQAAPEVAERAEPGRWVVVGGSRLAATLAEALDDCVCTDAAGLPAALAELEAAQVLAVFDEPDDGAEAALRTATEALAIAQASIGRAGRLCWVTRGAVAVADGEAVAVAAAPVWGLGRTLMQEHPELRCALIDVAAGEVDVAGLLRELASGDGEDQVALRSGGRHVARLVRIEAASEGVSQSAGHVVAASERGDAAGAGGAGHVVAASERGDAAGAGSAGHGVAASERGDAAGAGGAGHGVAASERGDAAGAGGAGHGVASSERGDAAGAGSAGHGVAASERGGADLSENTGHVVASSERGAAVSDSDSHVVALSERGGAAGSESGSVVAPGERGGVEVSQSAAQVVALSERGDAAVAGSAGHVVALSERGGAGVSQSAGRVVASSERGGVEVSQSAGQVVASSERGGVEVSQSAGRVVASSERGGVEVSQSAGRAVASSERGGVEVSQSAGRVVASSERGAAGSGSGSPVAPTDGTVLVTGGLGALGLHVARWLVERGTPHVLLVGRRGLAAPGAAEAVAELVGGGARVTVAAVDVADRAALAKVLAELPAALPLRGVVHAAGALEDGLVTAQTAEGLARVFAPKVAGAWNLHALTEGTELALFVLFSSLAGTLGAAGQANYAAANAWLDALAAHRRARGLPAQSLAWGPWAEVGMAAELGAAQRDRLARQGFAGLAPAQGLELLASALARPEALLGLAVIDPRAAGRVAGTVPPVWRALVTGDAAGGARPRVARAEAEELPTAQGWRERLSGLPTARRLERVRAAIQAEVGRVLSSGAAVAIDRPLQELGLDSLMAVELRNALATRFGVGLPATLVFDAPTVASLAERVLAAMKLAEAPATEAAAKLVDGSATEPADGLATEAATKLATGPADGLATNKARVGPAGEVPIAIVGMGCRLPGGVDDPEAFWRLLAEGRDAIAEVPRERWDAAALYDPDPSAVGKSICRSGGFLRDIDRFEPGFFGISPREAARMDPQQRLLLETSWEALERAGIAAERLGGSDTGVFVGLMYQEYGARTTDLAELDGYVSTGGAASVASGRLSYVLGLKGPSMTVDTACSSSLVTVHLACQALRRGECSLALAGGAALMLTPTVFVEFSRLRGLAPDGRCKSFAAGADGVGWSEGCGMLVLKRLPDALRDGDPVLGVIRGSAVNQDGRSNGLTAPNGPSQEAVIRKALAAAGVAPAELDYVECHGTGTSLGDPIEAQALGAVMLGARPADRPLVIGSVKSNLGHTQAAAGATGIMKVLLALQHETIPRSLHFDRPSPHVPWSELPLTVAQAAVAWPKGEVPRRAGVSSFGVSGTNAHVVIEEAPRAAERATGPRRPELVVLSARDSAALAEGALRLRAHVEARPELALADVALSLATGRAAMEQRLALVVGSRAELLAGLTAAAGETTPEGAARGRTAGETTLDNSARGRTESEGSREATSARGRTAGETTLDNSARGRTESEGSREATSARGRAAGETTLDNSARGRTESEGSREATSARGRTAGRPKVVFVFPGQGGQWLGMGRQLLAEEPVFRARLEECDRAIAAEVGWSVLAELQAPPETARLDRIEVVQPVLFAVEVGLAALWRSWGIEPDAVVGHSMGEVAAAHVAGALSLADAARVICRRSRLLQSISGAGEMAVVELSLAATEAALRGFEDRLSVAASNGPRTTVIAGEAAALAEVLARLTAAQVFCRRVKVDVASHSPQVEPLRGPLRAALGDLSPRTAEIPIRSTVTGAILAGPELGAEYWIANLREPVRFAGAIAELVAEGHAVFVEISPHPVLTPAVEEIRAAAGAPGVAVGSQRREQDERRALLESLAALWVHGCAPAWERVLPTEARRVPLPTYAWQRGRYWVEASANRTAHRSGHPLLGASQSLSAPAGARLWESEIASERPGWLADHRVNGTVVLPGAGSAEMMLAAATEALGGPVVLTEVAFVAALTLESAATVQVFAAEEEPGALRVQLASRRSEAPQGAWTVHARATARRAEAAEPATIDRPVRRAEVAEPATIDRAALLAEAAEPATIDRPARRAEGAEPATIDRAVRRAEVAEPATIDRAARRAEVAEPATIDRAARRAEVAEPATIDRAARRAEAAEPATIDRAALLAMFRAASGGDEGQSSEAVYASQAARGLEYGPAFRGIAALWRVEGQALARVRLVDGLADAGRCQIHPALLDACFQALAGVFAADEATWLPVAIEALRVHTPGARGELWCHVRLRPQASADRRTADLSVCDADGRTVVEVAGLTVQQVALRRRDASDEWFLEQAWEAVAAGPAKVGRGRFLLLGAGGGLGAALRGRLEAAGHAVVHAVAGAPGAVPAGCWAFDDGHPAGLRALLGDVFQGTGPTAVVHLRSLEGDCEVAEALARGCDSALHTVQALVEVGSRDAARLWLVTRGAQAIGGAPPEVGQAPLLGLARVVAMEHPELRCARVDLDPARPADEAALLMGELLADAAEDEVAWRGATRQVLRLVRRAPEAGRSARPWAPRADGSYVITGGLGGLGLVTAAWLVERGARHLVLVGRAGVTSEEQREAIAALERRGAQVTVAQADVAVREQVARVLAEVPAPLAGVVHAAGSLDDALLVQQDRRRLRAVMAPKIDGALHLDALTRGLPLDLFVLFGSAAGLLGAPGQGNYAAANVFLAALAHRRRAQGLAALCVDWGAFAEVGLAAASASRGERLAARGLRSLSPAEGLAALGRLLDAGVTQAAVLPFDLRQWAEFFPAAATSAMLSRLLTAPASARSGDGEALRAQLLRAGPEARVALLLERLRDEAARVLRLPAGELAVETPLTALGMDSLMGLELRNRIEATLGLRIPATLLWIYPTVTALAEHLAGLLAGPEATTTTRATPVEERAPAPAEEDDLMALLDASLVRARARE